jgi:hypothetical protein
MGLAASIWRAGLTGLFLFAFLAVLSDEAARHPRLTHFGPMVSQMAAPASRGFVPSRHDFDHVRQDAQELSR